MPRRHEREVRGRRRRVVGRVVEGRAGGPSLRRRDAWDLVRRESGRRGVAGVRGRGSGAGAATATEDDRSKEEE